MKHGKLGIKELHTGRNVSVLLYSGLITNARVVRKATPVREWLATESILGKPETRKDIFETELNVTLSVDDDTIVIPESDLSNRIQVFTTKEKAIKWAKRFGRETKIVSGSEMLETVRLNPIFGQGNRRIADEFGAKVSSSEKSSMVEDKFDPTRIIKRRSMMMGLTLEAPLDIIKQVTRDAKIIVERHGDTIFGTATGTPLGGYLYHLLSEVIHLNSLTHLEFSYDRDVDMVETLTCISSDGTESTNQDAIKEMLHVICTDYLDDVHVRATFKDGALDLKVVK